VPGVGDKLATARANVQLFGAAADAQFSRNAENAQNLADGFAAAADGAGGLRRELESFKPLYETTVRTNYVTTGNPNDVPTRSRVDVGLASGGYVRGPGTATLRQHPRVAV
jgi:hypothetical protein